VKGLLENIELNRVGKTTNYYAQQKTINVYVKHADDIKQRMLFSIIHPSDNPNVYFLKKHNKLGVNSKQIGTISRIENYGLFVRIKGIGTAMLHISELKKHGKNIFDYKINDEIEVKILNVDKEKNRVSLTL
ncbi:MAG: S1 RNA-binding domain-containing protein, partial [Bacteroidales bacterium]|nr:S1 RNA-binding domain-containing protein [Bacteroidales bacterium]